MKIALSLLLILLTCASFAQATFQPEKIRKQVLSLEQLLPAYNKTQLPTYLRKAYDTIFNCATVDELYELTNHPNPCVRRSAFGAMLKIETPKAFELLSKNAGDATQWFYVQEAAGNKIKKLTFVDEMLYYLLSYSGWASNFRMTPAQRVTATEMCENRTVLHE
ncbi:MAG: HEAT repeat domain-containing protein [Ferruginibacter sp.]